MKKFLGVPSRLFLVALAVMLVAAACGGDSGDSGDSGGGDGGDAVSGKLTISGSSTVEPITSLVAEKFQSANPDVSISVDGPGTTDGFVLFCEGKTQISDASRAIDPDEEIPACKKNGVDFIELKIAIDGLTVMTSPENDAVTCLSFADLYALLGPEAEGEKNWSDAEPLADEINKKADIPIHTPYPDTPLVITGPGEESGTWGSMIDLALKGIGEDVFGLDEVTTRPDYQSSANDNVIIQGVEGSPSSLGWVGFAYYEQNKEQIKDIAIDDGEGNCVEPSTETIASGEYPLSRPLYIYVNADDAANDPATKAFVDFYLSDDGLGSVSEVGYVDLHDDEIAATRDTWENEQTGSQG